MDIPSAVSKIYGLLELERKVVGIKLVRSEAEYYSLGATELSRPLAYCVAVKCAMAGSSIKLSRTTAGCKGSNRALGLAPASSDFFDGIHGRGLGLYKTAAIASNVATSVPICANETYGIVVKPIDLFETDPDVVLIVSSPGMIMRILQGYTYNYGLAKGMHISGNQAVCVECTVTPLKTDGINVSMLCSGTRHIARWKNTEAMVGISFRKFYGTVQGIERTVNAVEPDDRKKIIEEKLGATGDLEIEIDYGKTYYKKKK